MDILTIAISIVALTIALISSLPLLAKFLAYYFYQPRLEVFFPPPNRKVIKWLELENTPLNIRNKDKRPLSLEIEFVLDRPWKLKNERIMADVGLKGDILLKADFILKWKN